MTDPIVSAIYEQKIIAIVRGVDTALCMQVAQALYAGGIRLMEITYDQNDPHSWERTAQTIGALCDAFAGKMYIGAGTVTTVDLVELTARHGGRFILSPDVDPEVIRRTRELGLVSIPGALTPTEILTAHKAGAHFVKLFPAGVMGIDYLKAVRAPISHVPLLVVGNLDAEAMTQYLKAGAAGAGIGGQLVNAAWVEAGDFERITRSAREFVAAVQQIP